MEWKEKKNPKRRKRKKMNKVSRKILPKILIGVPTYDGKNYCLPQFLENISKFTYPKERLAIYVADNSIDNKNALMINKKYSKYIYNLGLFLKSP